MFRISIFGFRISCTMDLQWFKSINGYEIEGLWYPRVTSICKVIAKPGLERWLTRQGSPEAMAEKRRKITGFGSLVHNTLEQILMGEDPKIDDSIAPSVNAFNAWYGSHKVRALDVERRIVSKKHAYAGNIDVLAEIDGKFGILDIKTADRVWDDHFIQISAYFQAHNEGGLKKAQTYWVLRVDQYEECKNCGAKRRKKGGEWEIKGFGGNSQCFHEWSAMRGVCELQEVTDHEFYLETFLTAKKLWEMINRRLLAQIENYAGNKT